MELVNLAKAVLLGDMTLTDEEASLLQAELVQRSVDYIDVPPTPHLKGLGFEKEGRSP